jgi:predicted CoA-binding protein
MNDPVSARLELPDPLIAVVGATDNPSKYGGRIYRDLKTKGYRVVAVNPLRATVDGDEAYGSVADLPERPDIVNIVVPPQRTMRVLDDVADLDDVAVWIQPGAADGAVRERLADMEIPALVDACIMVQTRIKSEGSET